MIRFKDFVRLDEDMVDDKDNLCVANVLWVKKQITKPEVLTLKKDSSVLMTGCLNMHINAVDNPRDVINNRSLNRSATT